MRYHEETGEAYQIPKYEVIRTSLLPYIGTKLKLREIKNITGIKKNTLKFYLECAVKTGYIMKIKDWQGKYVYFKGRQIKTSRNVYYVLKTDANWYNIQRVFRKSNFKTSEPKTSDNKLLLMTT